LNYYFTQSRPDTILGYAGEMKAAYERIGSPQALLMRRRAGCLANLLAGRFEPAREEMQYILDMYDRDRDSPQFGMSTRDPKVSTCTFLGICLTILGFPDSGAAMSLAGVKHAELLDHAISLNLGLRRACVQGMLQRDARRVTEFSDQLAALRAAHETYKGSWEGTLFHDWARSQTESGPELLDRMKSVLQQLDSSRNWALLPYYLTNLAELHGQRRDRGAACALLERAAEISATTGSRWCEAEILRLKARFSAHSHLEAAALLNDSIALAREQSAKLWELRAATTLAELLSSQGEPDAARDVLMPVCSWFSEGAENADVVAARTLLDLIERHGADRAQPFRFE